MFGKSIVKEKDKMLSNPINCSEVKTHIREIKENGYTILKNYICKDKVNNLNKKADNIFKKIDQKQMLPVGLQGIIKNDCMINNAPAYDFDFLNLSTSGDHLNVIKYFLNDKYYNLIPETDPNFILAQSNLRAGKIGLPFHVDVRMVTKGYQTWSVQCFLALDNINYKNGCLKIIPESHLLDYMPDSNRKYKNYVDIDLNQGDMVIFSSQAHHSTYECEVSHKPPWTLLLTYRSWWCKQQFDFTQILEKRDIEKLNDNQKLLIGLCSVVPNDILASPSARHGYELFS